MKEESNHIALLKKWRARLFNISKRNPLLYPENKAQLINVQTIFLNPQELREQLAERESIVLSPRNNEHNIQFSELFSAAKKQAKERGHKHLSLSLLSLNWQLDGDEIQSPLYLLPVKLQKSTTYHLDALVDYAILNPVVESLLKQSFQIELPGSLPLESVQFNATLQSIHSLLKHAGFTVQTQPMYLGLFDYPEKSTVEDYNKLITDGEINSLIQQVFYPSKEPKLDRIPSSNVLLNECPVATFDPDQATAIARAMAGENLLISGPPGTGKSQTITNIISSALAKNKRVLLVSAKRAALESVYGKMKTLDLQDFCALIHHVEKDKAPFIEDLKCLLEAKRERALKTDRIIAERKTAILHYQQALQIMEKTQMLLKTIVPGACNLTIQELIVLLLQTNNQGEQANLQDLPNLGLYESHHDAFMWIYSEFIESYGLNQVSQHPLAFLHRSCWNKYSTSQEFNVAIDKEIQWWEKLVSMLDKLSLSQEITSLEVLQKFYTGFQPFIPIAKPELIPLLQSNSEAYLDFAEHFKQVKAQREALQQLKQFNAHWKQKFSLEEAQKILETLEQSEEKQFKFLYKNYRSSLFAIWQNSRMSFYERPAAETLLKKLIEEYRLEENTDQLEQQLLKKSQGISSKTLYQLLEQWHVDLDEHLKAVYFRLLSSAMHRQNLQDFFTFLQSDQSKGNILNTQNIREGLKQLHALQDQRDTIKNSFEHFKTIAVNEEAYGFVWTIGQDYPKKVIQVLRNTWKETSNQYPWLVEQSGEKYKANRDALIQAKGEIIRLNARQLKAEKDKAFHEILRAAQLSASGLNEEEKEALGQLRAGLKILEKETSKTRAFQSFRTWQEGPGHAFIEQIKPVWMMSPDSLSDALPLEKDAFDLVIFDEASQLSLAACLPALYRAKQCIVVGDERQLPPSQFFEKSIEFIDESSDQGLLPVAKQVFPQVDLNWHYRSQDEALIRYNNEVFYANKLKTIPSTKISNSICQPLTVKDTNQAAFNYSLIREYAIGLHYVENGRYINGVNETEARYIAELCKHFLLSQQALNLGVICLSNSQQASIQAALKNLMFFDKTYDQLLQEKYANDKNFDGIFLRNLENVQGEERDIILVSLGYGPNENEHLHLNFGPVNQEGGDRRLNVLFSRARKHMAVISSFRSEAIHSDNPGALCLKNYLALLEKPPSETTSMQDSTATTKQVTWVKEIGQAIEQRGYKVDYNYGYSSLHFALAVRSKEDDEQYVLGILAEDDNMGTSNFKMEVLPHFGWHVIALRDIDYLVDKKGVLSQVFQTIEHIEQNNKTEIPQAKRSDHLDELKYDESKLLFTRLEINENDHLFWELAGNLNDIIIRYGKVGSKGRKLIKSYESVAQVIKEKRRLIRQKEKQGYRRV